MENDSKPKNIHELLTKKSELTYFRWGKNHPWHRTNELFFDKHFKRFIDKQSRKEEKAEMRNLSFLNNYKPEHWQRLNWFMTQGDLKDLEE